MGFIGCPIAVAIGQNLMPLFLFLYVQFVGGKECWPGFSRKAFTNWGPMGESPASVTLSLLRGNVTGHANSPLTVSLALPGFVMLFAEVLAFEIITLAAAQMSATHLAANSIIQSLSVIAFQLPYPLSIAGSTRVANLIGASLPDAAKVTAQVILVLGTIVGVINVIALGAFRNYVPQLYTNEADVIALAAATLPVNAAFQLFDALACQCNGILRGLGRQKIGGYVSLLVFYGVSRPLNRSN